MVTEQSLKNDRGIHLEKRKSRIYCLNSFRSLWENSLQASILKSRAAARATKAAASSVQVTCCTPTSTSGLLHFPSPSTVADITNPLLKTEFGSNPKSKLDPDPEPDPRSQLPRGVFNGVTPEVASMVNFPPCWELMVDPARVTGSAVAGRI